MLETYLHRSAHYEAPVRLYLSASSPLIIRLKAKCSRSEFAFRPNDKALVLDFFGSLYNPPRPTGFKNPAGLWHIVITIIERTK